MRCVFRWDGAAVAPLGRRHASFAQTVLACSETGAAVNLWSLTGTARQLSSQAAELARRGMPRPFSATAAGHQPCSATLFRCDRAFMQSAALVRSDQAVPSCAACGVAKAARCATIGGGCQPRRATQEERARSRVQRARPRGRDPRSREDERWHAPRTSPCRTLLVDITPKSLSGVKIAELATSRLRAAGTRGSERTSARSRGSATTTANGAA